MKCFLKVLYMMKAIAKASKIELIFLGAIVDMLSCLQTQIQNGGLLSCKKRVMPLTVHMPKN